uniref:Uncharacterized protein n=1 Tax=Kalanchoe fedtschenkoi TaxID=63787 RepID=A0A7N0U322_KALFE
MHESQHSDFFALYPSRLRIESTGSCSKRQKLRDLLLRRSNSDGKESFVYLTPSSSASSSNSNSASEEVKSVKLKQARRPSGEYKSAHEMFYVKNRAVKEEDRRRSYLPYRKGLVGFGFLPNGMSLLTNNFRPF